MKTDAGQRLTRRGVARLAVAALVATSIGARRSTDVAAAESVDDCQKKIEALRDATLQVKTFTNEKDLTGLVDKLDSSSTKLATGKFGDAVKGSDRLPHQGGRPCRPRKIASCDATALIGANDAVACIQALTA